MIFNEKRSFVLSAILLILVGLTVIGLSFSQLNTSYAAPIFQVTMVDIENFAFDPSTITQTPNTEITWTNNDAAIHNVTGDGWGSSNLNNGESFSTTFSSPGTYAYICSIHPSMTGEVVIESVPTMTASALAYLPIIHRVTDLNMPEETRFQQIWRSLFSRAER